MKLVALMGKSGSGKDTILNAVTKMSPDKFNKIISCTTRPIRENEQYDVDYHYLNKLQFTAQIEEDEMLEYTSFNGWMYGTSINSLSEDKINIGVFNPAGVRQLLANKNIDITVFYIQADGKYRLMRQLTREDYPNIPEILRRYQTDENDFDRLDDIPYIEMFNYDLEDITIIAEFINDKFN